MIFVAWVVCAVFVFKLLWNVSIAFDAAVERIRQEERSAYFAMPYLEFCLLGIGLLLYW